MKKNIKNLLLIFIRPIKFVERFESSSKRRAFFLAAFGGFCFFFFCFNKISNIVMLNFIDNLIMVSLLSVPGLVIGPIVLCVAAALFCASNRLKFQFKVTAAILSAVFFAFVAAFFCLMAALLLFNLGHVVIQSVVVNLKINILYRPLNLSFTGLVGAMHFLSNVFFFWSFVILAAAFYRIIENRKKTLTGRRVNLHNSGDGAG